MNWRRRFGKDWGRLGLTFNSATIGDIASVQTGPFGSQLHNEDYVSIGTPIVTVEHLGQRKMSRQNLPCVSAADKRRLSKYTLEYGDLIFSRVGSVDRCSWVSEEEDGWMFSGRCLRVRPKDPLEIYHKYLYYFFSLESTKDFVRNIAVGATMPSINTRLLSEVPITFPNIEQQHEIGDILSAFDDRIEANAKINHHLAQMAQAIFKSWFVDFEPWDGVMPDDWRDSTLDELCAMIVKGVAPKYDDSTTQLVINQKCIRNRSIDLSLARSHKPKTITEKWLRYGDVLINSTGEGTLGRAAQFLFDLDNITVDSHVTIVRPKYKELIEYLGLWCVSRESLFASMSSGSTGQTDLPRERLKLLKVLLPNVDTLRDFSGTVAPLIKKQIMGLEESARLATLRDALLPRFMSGELSVAGLAAK